MTVLMGPADADHFRVKVGRYHDRWYTDPLPSCEIAKASEWQGPAVSTIKKAASQDWSYVAMKRCARDIITHPEHYDTTRPGKELEAIYEQLKVANKVGLDIDAGRGTIIHLWCEDLLHGRPMRDITEWDLAAAKLTKESLTIATTYQPALQAWFDAHRPELVASEVVCIHRMLNAVGYGGTADTFCRIDGDLYVVDWKSRGPSSDHGAYPEEAAQVAALATAEYMIVDNGAGEAMREILYADRGLIVSIKPEGCRAYPIDLAKAAAHWQALHAWWCASRNERDAIGRSWPARNSSAEPDTREASGLTATATAGRSSDKASAEEPRRLALLARYQAMSEPEQLAFCDLHINPNDLDAVQAGLDSVDKFNCPLCNYDRHICPGCGASISHGSFACNKPPCVSAESTIIEPPSPPHEGGLVTTSEVSHLEQRFAKLPLEAQLWTGRLVAEGKQSYDFRIKDHPTVRRHHIYCGILALAEWGKGHEHLDDIIKAIVYQTIGNREKTTAGEAIGLLNYADAKEFAELAQDIAQDRCQIRVDEAGTLRLTTAV